jgi:hypothetical protein
LVDLVGKRSDDAGGMVDDVSRGLGWPLLVEPGVIEGEPRADGHGDVLVDRCRGVYATVGSGTDGDGGGDRAPL